MDSSVVAALLHRAIGDQLTCVFVDNGLLRLNEGDHVMDMFARNMGVKVIRADCEDLFLGKLAGVADPEAKRKVIGNTFIEVFDEEATRLKDVKWLAQGTIYPDVIESAGAKTGKAHVIKSHHNVGGLPDDMTMELVEPLRELFKDEVRKIGLELGLPYDMVYRHPFPGPGLGVRILGEVKKEYAELLRQADAIKSFQVLPMMKRCYMLPRSSSLQHRLRQTISWRQRSRAFMQPETGLVLQAISYQLPQQLLYRLNKLFGQCCIILLSPDTILRYSQRRRLYRI